MCLLSLTFGFYSLHDESERCQLTLVACGLYLETSSRNRCFLSLSLFHIWPLLVITGKNQTVSVLEFFLCISLQFRNRTSSNNSENVMCDSREEVFASVGEMLCLSVFLMRLLMGVWEAEYVTCRLR